MQELWLFFCKWARRTTVHENLHLAVGHDDEGVPFTETSVCDDTLESHLPAWSISILEQRTLRPVSSEGFPH